MAVVGFAQEIGKVRALELQNNRRQYFRTFRVIVDSRYDGPQTVMTAALLPAPYAEYSTSGGEFDPGARVVRREPTQDTKSPFLWTVSVEYDTEYDRKDGNPFLRDPDIDYGFEFYREPLPGIASQFQNQGSEDVEDAWGTGIINSAGDTYDPPPERDAARPVLTFARNEPTFNSLLAVKFICSVNNNTWNGLRPRQAMCRGIAAKFQREKSSTFGVPDILYWHVTYTFVLKKETWDLQLLNYGKHYVTGAIPNRIRHPFTGVGGEPVLGLLDATGGKLTDGADPTYSRFKVYREESFGLLNINLGILGV